MPVIEVVGVTKDYTDRSRITTRALRGVDLTVEPGEFMAIAGPSGSGKTTLLNLIGALDRATRGSIRVDGRELAGMSQRALSDLRRDHIGFVFQAYNLVPVLTAAENAEYVMELKGVPAAEPFKLKPCSPVKYWPLLVFLRFGVWRAGYAGWSMRAPFAPPPSAVVLNFLRCVCWGR